MIIITRIEIPCHTIDTPPTIDGEIDSIWYSTIIINNFTQWFPQEGALATESTKVYICYDDKNLYIAFKCFDSDPEKLEVKIVHRDYYVSGDYIWVMLDTFGDKNTAYEFGVNAAGVQCDDKLYQDGRITDATWDGVWYSAAKIADYGYNVEMKIPFKTLKFKPELTEWGVNFFRYIPRKNECVSWAPLKQAEGIRVSRCGILKGIQPGKQALHLEVYPVALAMYEPHSIHPKAGLDVSWGFTSSQFSLTAYPDFAQIEADPYTINLSKYEIYFDERRPFFIEGQEIFDTPIKLFYSRRVGKRIWVDEEVKEIPIIGGAKYTGTIGRTSFGLLSAYTDNIADKPKTLYSSGRLKFGVLKNSEVGIIYSEARSEVAKQAVAGIDMAFRTTELQIQSQFAHSDSGDAVKSKLDWYGKKFFARAGYEGYDKRFDIERIGFAPWGGTTKYLFAAGPQWFNKSIFHQVTTGINIGGKKEVDEPKSGYWFGLSGSAEFVNNWWSHIDFITGQDYEMNKVYNYYSSRIYFSSDYSKSVVVSGDVSYTSDGFNYHRNYFAPTSQNNLSVEWRVSPPLSLSVDISNTIEWKPDKELEAITWIFRPILQYALTKDMHLRIYAEPNTDTHIHQFNALLSYNFRPKSWFYIALNETRDNTYGKLTLKERIGGVKMRYLFFL